MHLPPPLRVLLVDDDPAILRLLTLLCGQLEGPVHVESATTAAEARQRLAAWPQLDLLISDLVMESPAAGLALARWVRDQPRLQDAVLVLHGGEPPGSDESPFDHVWHKGTLDFGAVRSALTALVADRRARAAAG